MQLLSLPLLVMPPCSGFAVKRNKGGFFAAVPWCGAPVALLQVVDHDSGVKSVWYRSSCDLAAPERV